MAYLLDTNVLLRYARTDDPLHPTVLAAIDALFDAQEEVCLVPQNLFEFWNVATRPVERNGFGLGTAQAETWLGELEAIFSLRPDIPDIFPRWRRLAANYDVQGVQVHDTRLVAAMLAHGLSHILTFNGGDFRRFEAEGITVVAPSDLPNTEATS